MARCRATRNVGLEEFLNRLDGVVLCRAGSRGRSAKVPSGFIFSTSSAEGFALAPPSGGSRDPPACWDVAFGAEIARPPHGTAGHPQIFASGKRNFQRQYPAVNGRSFRRGHFFSPDPYR